MGGDADEALQGHTKGITSLAFTQDGSRIVTGSYDKTIRVWCSRTGRAIGKPLLGHTRGVISVAVSPDGTRLASGSTDETVTVWDVATGKKVLGPLRGHTLWAVTSVAFSPNGALIASGSRDCTVRVWGALTGELVIGPLEGHTGGVNTVAFSPNGKQLASGSEDGSIIIWNVELGNSATSLAQPTPIGSDWTNPLRWRFPDRDGWVKNTKAERIIKTSNTPLKDYRVYAQKERVAPESASSPVEVRGNMTG